MPDPAPLLPAQPGLQGGGTFPTQVRVVDGLEPMANVKVLEDTGDVLVWLGDSMITASKILLSHMDPRELQVLILTHSVDRMGYMTDAPNLFTADSVVFTAENTLWIEDVINGNPVQFMRQASAAPAPQQQTTAPVSTIPRPDIPVFTPDNRPTFSRRTG
jgi:hypothetical protein